MALDQKKAVKVRTEIDQCLLKPAQTKDLFEAMTYDRIFEMKYFAMLFQEGLRFMPVASSSSIFEVTQDMKIGKIQLKTDDKVNINIFGLHHNPDEWIEPKKFIPERFDPESAYYLTPSGNKRDPSSYMPFLTGKRSCFGKTFAEVAPRVVVTMLLHEFEIELEDKYKEEKIPCYVVSLKPPPEVHFTFTKRKL
jgi:cytochrome P450